MDNPIIEIFDGKVRGIVKKNLDDEPFCAFLGIPYGKPPIGDKRFKAPEPCDKWEGVRDCTKDGEKNIQIEPLVSLDVQGSEDCLHLNVFTKKIPESTLKLKPVMVFWFGGRFRHGSNRNDLFGPDFLLMEDIVLVLPNCRVGLLGFLSLKDSSLGVPGNAALKDQVLALKWVQKNIHRFGGDPNNVTLAGHSSGGMAVHHHLLSPLSEGLFHKAIIMSGSVLSKWAERSEFSIELFADILNMKGQTEKEILHYLQSLPAKALLEAQQKYFNEYDDGISLLTGPVVENPNKTAFISKDPTDLLLNGEFHKVPLLMTYTSDEGLVLELLANYVTKNGDQMKDVSLEVEQFIPHQMRAKMDEICFQNICTEMENCYSGNLSQKRSWLMSDIFFIAPLIAAARAHAELSDQPVYLMRWSMDDQLNFMKALCGCLDVPGTAHGDDVGYIFSRKGLTRPKKGSQAEKIVKKAVHLIKSFCHHGNPALCQSDTVSKWQPLQANKTHYIDFGNEIKMVRFPELKRMEVWQKILECDKRDTKLGTLSVL